MRKQKGVVYYWWIPGGESGPRWEAVDLIMNEGKWELRCATFTKEDGFPVSLAGFTLEDQPKVEASLRKAFKGCTILKRLYTRAYFCSWPCGQGGSLEMKGLSPCPCSHNWHYPKS
jgi:hypothetical protein